MKFTYENVYDRPIELVVEGFFDVGLYDMTDLDNVSHYKILEQKDDGTVIKRIEEWSVHGQIPPLAQKMIKPEHLSFRTRSTWDRRTNKYSFTVEPHFFKKQVDIAGVTAYIPENGKTRRRIDAVVKVKLPLIGAVVEKAIIKNWEKNYEQDYQLSKRVLEEWIKKEGKA